MDISKRVAKELGNNIEEAEQEKDTSFNGWLALAASLSVIVSGTYFYSSSNIGQDSQELFALEASKQISEAVNSPEAIALLDSAVKGMNVQLQNIDSGIVGQLYAYYRIPSNGKSFKVSFFGLVAVDGSSSAICDNSSKSIFLVSITSDSL